jgi:outer membrane protein OmpA-like peptidoglycan-associated protein
MKHEALKIGLRGAFFFCLATLFCLQIHLKNIPDQLKSQCIQKVENIGGQVTLIRMNGRHVTIHGKVPASIQFGSVIDSISSIPLLKTAELKFIVQADSVKQNICHLSGRFVLFSKNSAQPPVSAEGLLDSLAQFLKTHPDTRLTLRGWTDAKGDSAYNQKLSEERALAIYNALLNRACDPNGLQLVGYGEQWPDSVMIPDSMARRVDFIFEE